MIQLFWAGCLSLFFRLQGGAYLQPPHCSGLVGEWDSGYDSLRRRMSVLDRLTETHQVWLLLAVSEDEASSILLKQPPGVRGHWIGLNIMKAGFVVHRVFFQVFLVRKSAVLQKKVLSVRLDEDHSESPISHFHIRESQYGKSELFVLIDFNEGVSAFVFFFCFFLFHYSPHFRLSQPLMTFPFRLCSLTS